MIKLSLWLTYSTYNNPRERRKKGTKKINVYQLHNKANGGIINSLCLYRSSDQLSSSMAPFFFRSYKSFPSWEIPCVSWNPKFKRKMGEGTANCSTLSHPLWLLMRASNTIHYPSYIRLPWPPVPQFWVLVMQNVKDHRYIKISGIPRNFFLGVGRFNKCSWGQRTERMGSGGIAP